MMKLIIYYIACLGIVHSLPYYSRDRSTYPRRAMIFSGYYGNTYRRSSEYTPGSMTAFLAGDTVATGSYSGNNFPLYTPEEEDIEATTLENIEVSTTPKTKRLSKKKKPITPKPEETNEEEEEGEKEESPWPLSRNPAYNTFFPIIFGGYPGGKARSDSEINGYPGAATAIANSFSTGKGGVASSHATAFGDPALSTLLRNGNFNFKGSKQD